MLLRMVQKRAREVSVTVQPPQPPTPHKDTMVIRTKALRDVHFLNPETMNV